VGWQSRKAEWVGRVYGIAPLRSARCGGRMQVAGLPVLEDRPLLTALVPGAPRHPPRATMELPRGVVALVRSRGEPLAAEKISVTMRTAAARSAVPVTSVSCASTTSPWRFSIRSWPR